MENAKQASHQRIFVLAKDQAQQLESWLTDVILRTADKCVASSQETGDDLHQVVQQQFPRHFELYTLAYAIHRTAKSILKVCADGDVDSGYVLGRTLVERAINLAFLNVCDDRSYENWIAYSRQKAFRLLDRRQTAGPAEFRISLSPMPDLSSVPGLKEDLQRFTGTKRGGEITRWTKLSLGDRLGAIEGKFKSSTVVMDLLLQAMTHTYDLGAEAQHATLLGVGIPFGYFAPPNTTRDTHAFIIAMSTIECLFATISEVAYMADRPEWGDQAMNEMVTCFKEMIPEEAGSGGP